MNSTTASAAPISVMELAMARTALANANSRLGQILGNARIARATLRQAELEILEILAQTLAVGADQLKYGRRSCANSPVAVCIYDVVFDPASDACLYCEEPHEQK